MTAPLTLSQLNTRIAAAVAADHGLNSVWVTGETSDLRISGGHCYFELIEKDPDTGRAKARLRAIIWASDFARISLDFLTATGHRLASDIKVLVRASVNFHPVFGLSAVVSDIDPEYTCGDLIRRRNLLIKRLTEEGIIDMNRTLPWSPVVWRVAVISAQGAAGYGDFINHLYTNPSRFRFHTELFPAVMQGERAPQSIIEALEAVAERCADFDCVVIIRGGGATGDLTTMDDYDLAANVAQFPIPVIVGVGHERDTTILDHVAALRVKTPTAAASWLIDRAEATLDRLRSLTADILAAATSHISGGLQHLAYQRGMLPTLAAAAIDRANSRLDTAAQLVEVLSPDAVLRRGYAICRNGNHVVTDPTTVAPGTVITTVLAKGTFNSIVTNTDLP